MKHITIRRSTLSLILGLTVFMTASASALDLTLSGELQGFKTSESFTKNSTANGNNYGTSSFKSDGSTTIGFLVGAKVSGISVGIGLANGSIDYQATLTSQAKADTSANNADITTAEGVLHDASSSASDVAQATSDIANLKVANRNITNSFNVAEDLTFLVLDGSYTIPYRAYGWSTSVGARVYKPLKDLVYSSSSPIALATLKFEHSGFYIGAQGNKNGIGYLGGFQKSF